MELLSKGHFGNQPFCPLTVLFSEVKMFCIYTFGDIGSVPCREVVPFSKGPLLEVLYCTYTCKHNYSGTSIYGTPWDQACVLYNRCCPLFGGSKCIVKIWNSSFWTILNLSLFKWRFFFYCVLYSLYSCRISIKRGSTQ